MHHERGAVRQDAHAYPVDLLLALDLKIEGQLGGARIFEVLCYYNLDFISIYPARVDRDQEIGGRKLNSLRLRRSHNASLPLGGR